MDLTKDYTPLSDRAPGASQEWPVVERFGWTRNFEDGTVAAAPRRRPRALDHPRPFPRPRDD